MIRPLCILLIFLSFATDAQEIAITFDDAPTADGPLLSGEGRALRIIGHLKNHKVEQVAFFVLTGTINKTNELRLKKYVDAGHLLGNHSHTHQRTRSAQRCKNLI